MPLFFYWMLWAYMCWGPKRKQVERDDEQARLSSN